MGESTYERESAYSRKYNNQTVEKTKSQLSKVLNQTVDTTQSTIQIPRSNCQFSLI